MYVSWRFCRNRRHVPDTQITRHLIASPQILKLREEGRKKGGNLQIRYFRLQERKQKALFIWTPQLANELTDWKLFSCVRACTSFLVIRKTSAHYPHGFQMGERVRVVFPDANV